MILRLLLILAVMTTVPFTVRIAEPRQLIFTFLVIGIVLTLLVLELTWFLNRTNRELSRFLRQIRDRDFSMRFNEEKSRGFGKLLYRDFNQVLEVYQDIRIEKEVQFRFLEHIVELLETGILVFDSQGKVVLSNTAATELTGLGQTSSWKQLQVRNSLLASAIGSLERSDSFLFESSSGSTSPKLMVQLTRTRMLDQSYTLVSFQDVKGVVDQKESGAWNRLLRTLNHEIKNSITPIVSLADTIMLILKEEELSLQQMEDLKVSARTLQERSKGLYDFVNEYHKLTRIPAPDPEMINCVSFMKAMSSLFSADLEKTGIQFKTICPEKELEIRADRNMLEQAVINLMNNSMEALGERQDAEIILEANKEGKEVEILITDNGQGIDPSVLEDIFTPFFSTKSGGSGIGLPLVKQIMRLHGGSVSIYSLKDQGTRVSLRFPEIV